MQAEKEKFTLRQWRVIKGYTIKRLAAETNITDRTIHSYETDVEKLRGASYRNLESLANVLGIATDDIFLSPNSEKPKYNNATTIKRGDEE